MGFRKDINGLRAIAVLAVILFHFNPAWLPGGFAGVDVFFVISGFLMTGIIFKGIEKDNLAGGGHSFSLFRFYWARATRIIPALAALCLLLLVFGWLFLIPLDYKELGKHAAGSVAFVSNIVYWQEAGYFDAASHEKWLLHTWSLSVEWQFYIIYPLVLLALRKFLPVKLVKLSVLVGAVLGFIFCVVVTYKWANAAYFLLPTRAWEMLLGGVAFLYPIQLSDKSKKYIEWVGLALIISTYLLVSSSNPWPGYLAIFSVFGTFLVIQAHRNNSYVTGNIVFQKIGLWSYSIYLWHWVIVVANVKFNLDISFALYLCVTLMLAFVSYQLFERRNNTLLIVSFTSSFVFSLYVIYANGAEFRVDEKFQLDRSKFHSKYYGGSGYPANRFIYINSTEADHDFVFVGDSYGLQYARALEENDYKVAGLFNHGCLILPNYSLYLGNKEDVSCSVEYDKLKPVLKNTNKPLIMGHFWDTYRNFLIKKSGDKPLTLTVDDYYDLIQSELDTIVHDNGLNRSYFILGVPQRAKINAFECLAGTQLVGYRVFNKCSEVQEQQDMAVNSMLSDWAAKRENTYFINPNDFLCTDGQCLIIKDREPVHSDGSHLSVFGAPIVVDGMFKFINEKLAHEQVLLKGAQ